MTRRIWPSAPHRAATAFLLITFLAQGLAHAAVSGLSQPPRAVPPLVGRVIDLMGVLPTDKRREIERSLAKFELDTGGVQIGVLVVDTTGPESIERYAERVSEVWRLGGAFEEKGALLLVAVNDRKLRIQVGVGLSKALTDEVSKNIIQQDMIPLLRQADFTSAIRVGLEKMMRAATGYRMVPANSLSGANTTRVPMIGEGGTYKVPVTINGVITLSFTVDSGASDVSIPIDVVSTLVRSGTVKDSDYIGSRQYVLADGSVIKSPTFMLRALKVGNQLVTDVRASVADRKGDLLLGQSFLEKFTNWAMDNSRHELVLAR